MGEGMKEDRRLFERLFEEKGCYMRGWRYLSGILFVLPAVLLSCGQTNTERSHLEPEALAWSTFLGGSGEDEATAVFVDEGGNVYVTGWTESVDFPTTPGAFAESHGGGGDVFVVKLDSENGQVLYSTLLGGGDWDEAFGVVVGAHG
jgi:hypothetical protein